ncbi:MAG: ester cyclase [Chloroflexota bacterium]|nr:MAG: ester cyclase [Chloroflexota bacterium]
MSVEANKQLIRRFYDEVWNQGNTDFVFQVFAENYVRHDLRPGNPRAGAAGQQQVADDFRAAFPDLKHETELLLGENDFVVARWTMQGTNSAPWGNQPATGKFVRMSGVNIFRFENDKVVEIWNHRDDLGMREQLGAPIYAGSNRA